LTAIIYAISFHFRRAIILLLLFAALFMPFAYAAMICFHYFSCHYAAIIYGHYFIFIDAIDYAVFISVLCFHCRRH